MMGNKPISSTGRTHCGDELTTPPTPNPPPSRWTTDDQTDAEEQGQGTPTKARADNVFHHHEVALYIQSLVSKAKILQVNFLCWTKNSYLIFT